MCICQSSWLAEEWAQWIYEQPRNATKPLKGSSWNPKLSRFKIKYQLLLFGMHRTQDTEFNRTELNNMSMNRKNMDTVSQWVNYRACWLVQTRLLDWRRFVTPRSRLQVCFCLSLYPLAFAFHSLPRRLCTKTGAVSGACIGLAGSAVGFAVASAVPAAIFVGCLASWRLRWIH